MKKTSSNFILIIILLSANFINSRYASAQSNITKSITSIHQTISDKALLTQLKSEEAESGLAILVDLSINKIISKSSFIKKGKLYVSDSSLFTQPIEPGSLIMPMSAAIIMDNFGVTLNDTCDLEKGKTVFDGHVIVDAEQHGKRYTNLKNILGESSNVGISKLVNNNFKSHDSKISFENKIKNCIESNNYISKDTTNNSLLPLKAIGYGIQLTPNEIFNFYKRVANSDATLFEHQSTMSQVQNALAEVCENGTAKLLFTDSKYSFAGKTSTSLVSGKNGYSNVQFQAAFIGYSSAINPRYACMVIIKCHPHAASHFGASVAGPVFKTIMENALKSVTSYKVIKDSFEKIIAPDSIQLLLSKNMKYYHHLEDSISNIRRTAFEKDPNYKEQIKSFVIEGKEYTGYDGGALGYYMNACWSHAFDIIKKFMPITRVAGCGNEYDSISSNHNINYYICEFFERTYANSNIGEPIIKSKNLQIYFYDK
jgi:hypothetical protein